MTEFNQLENQDEIKINNQLENNLMQNVSCNIFKEQFDLINELPEKDRANVLYLAVYNAFYMNDKNKNNQDDNQLENQDENTYISISISISKYLSNISKSVLNLLYKTIVCKNYNKNWGGKRKGAGKPIKEEPQTPKKYQDDYQDEKQDIENINKENFQKFWNLCPKQTDELKCYGTYVNIVSEGVATYEEIENGMRDYSEYVKNNEISQKYISSPFNWLNGRRWLDKLDTTGSKKLSVIERVELYRRKKENEQETVY